MSDGREDWKKGSIFTGVVILLLGYVQKQLEAWQIWPPIEDRLYVLLSFLGVLLMISGYMTFRKEKKYYEEIVERRSRRDLIWLLFWFILALSSGYWFVQTGKILLW